MSGYNEQYYDDGQQEQYQRSQSNPAGQNSSRNYNPASNQRTNKGHNKSKNSYSQSQYSSSNIHNKSQNSQIYSQDNQPLTRHWQWAYPIIQGQTPCQRGGHSATLSGASIIIFGGHYYTGRGQGYTYLNDTYVLDVNANKFTKPKISGTPPAPRYFHSAVLAGSKIMIFGGKGPNNKVYRDLHALDPISMTWLQGPQGIGSPGARYGHSGVLVNQTKIFIFGGTNGKQYFGDLFILDLQVMAWTQPKTTGPAPSPRMGHTAIQVDTNMIIQGGFCFNQDMTLSNPTGNSGQGYMGTKLQNCYLNDIRVLDTQKLQWARVRVSGTPPLPRYSHTSNISGPNIIFFGGWSINSGARGQQNFIPPAQIDYFLVLNTQNQLLWQRGKFQGQPPLSRYGHTATSIGPHILIFGGWQYNRAASQVVVLRDMTASLKNGKK